MMDKIQYQKAVESKEVLYLIVFKDVFKRIASMEKTTEHRDKTKYDRSKAKTEWSANDS